MYLIRKTGFNSILKVIRIQNISVLDKECVLKCIVTGLFPNAAYLHPSGQYKSIRNYFLTYEFD